MITALVFVWSKQNSHDLTHAQGPNGTQAPQSKYAELLAIIEELGKEIRPTYAGSKSAMERLKRGILIVSYKHFMHIGLYVYFTACCKRDTCFLYRRYNSCKRSCPGVSGRDGKKCTILAYEACLWFKGRRFLLLLLQKGAAWLFPRTEG